MDACVMLRLLSLLVPQVIVKVLTDARRSLLALQQSLLLCGLGQLCAAGMHLMCVWMGLPPLLPIHHALWLTLVTVPVASLGMTFSNADEEGASLCVCVVCCVLCVCVSVCLSVCACLLQGEMLDNCVWVCVCALPR
ncbi:MAG: hypothetical protein P4L40_08585 [Terracidiphilus sp.]|nr:hypothetical protein [Terracidiphilus sp.]